MPAPSRPNDPAFAELLVNSYARVVGGSFPRLGVNRGAEAAQWLYETAPFGLLVHDTAADPLFVYANRAAQKAFEYSWDEFVGLPSRLSAEAPNRTKRQEFMDQVRHQGFVEHYRGRRVAKSGRVFWIEETTVWNVIDENDVLQGQAALIRRTT